MLVVLEFWWSFFDDDEGDPVSFNRFCLVTGDLLKPSVVKLIIYYFPDIPGRPIGGNAEAEVGDILSGTSWLFLIEESRGVSLLLLNVMPPFPVVFIGIKFRNELVAVFDMDAFLWLGSGEWLVD